LAAVPWRDLALVAAGGALGALARFGVSSALPRLDFPWHTLLVNLAGSLVLGYLFLDHGMEHPARLAIAVGFLGAFTTLSTYSAETVDLWRSGHAGLALANVAANGLGGPAFALVGWRLAALAA
jgi:CrcB protein